MNYHKFALFLGAGFTKNFGGPLASEMWALIFNQPSLQNSKRLKEEMIKNINYEDIYNKILETTSYFSENEKRDFQKSIYNAYQHIDRIIYNLKDTGPIDLKKVKDSFIDLICPRNNHKGFIFTLNQDLFFERLYKQSPELTIPGIKRGNHKQQSEGYQYPLKYPDDYYILPSNEELEKNPIENNLGKFSYIKLHGSYNFVSADVKTIEKDMPQMVIGSAKEEHINKEPILKSYFDLFKKVINSGNIKLLIVGYGFQDQHINTLLNQVVEKNLVKIYILNPTDPWKLRNAMYGRGASLVWENLSGYFPYDFYTLFPNNYPGETPAWQDVLQNFFEIKIL